MKKLTLNISIVFTALILVVLAVGGCSSSSEGADSSSSAATTTETTESASGPAETAAEVAETEPEVETPDSIMVYCGSGMRKPMDEIGQLFEEQYGIKVAYNYAGSNALLSQMELTQEGDAYMPGAATYIETAAEKGLVDYQQMVAYHIPVITVPKGNPSNITCLEDLARDDVTLVWGDPEVAAIGKTGKKILENNGLYDAVWPNVVATFPTMAEVMTQISLGQADAAVNWWDTVKFVEDIDVVEIAQEQNSISVIPVGTTTFSEYPEIAKQYVDFVVSDTGKDIFTQHGFIVYPNEQYEK